MVIANVFPKLQPVKNFGRPPCKNRRFWTCFERQHVKVSHILAKSPWEHFYHVFLSFWGKLICKISPLLLGAIWGMFLKTLAVEGKYPIKDWQNLPLPSQMQLSAKSKVFSQFFLPLLESTSILKILKQKDNGHS